MRGLFSLALSLTCTWLIFPAASGIAQRELVGGDAELAAEGEPLHLSDVLESVQTHHPVLRAEIENVKAALGGQVEARGAYDPVLEMKGSVGPAGYYDYNLLDASVSQLTPLWGAELYAGYRVEGQTLPQYYGELRTLSRGQVRAGVRIPLWKDRSIDQGRAGRREAQAEIDATEGQRDQALLALWRGAAAAYYGWTAALLDRQVQTDLLTLAQTRVGQVRGKVESGAIPPIEALDNERALLGREVKLVEAQRKLEQAGLKLALYLRDTGGRMRVPREMIPEPLTLPELPASFDEAAHIERALNGHPELARYAAEVRALGTQLALAENAVAPDLAVAGEIRKSFGEGGTDELRALEPVAVRVSAMLKLPLALRKARGKRDAVSAKLRAVEAKMAYARDKLRAEALSHAAELRAALARADRTKRMAQVAEQLAAGERDRFELGATTLIWVTTREKTAADAKIDAIHAVAEARVALSAYRTALAQKPL